MVLKRRKRWRPPPAEFRRTVAAVASEMFHDSSVSEIFWAVRRRCPEWSVTPHRVRRALAELARLRKKESKSSGSGARGRSGRTARAFPHDVVELTGSARHSKNAQWQWRGQVLRVAGYDDGEAADEDEQELPPNHCSVFWLGRSLEQSPNTLTREAAVRVVDRPWVLGDRVARREDPRSLGTIAAVNCRLRFAGIVGASSGPARATAAVSPEVPAQLVPAVGGFRAEDWVANEATRWVGRVEEAVFRVEVELLGRDEEFPPRGRGRRRPPACVFEVSSEGLAGLGPAGGEDVNPQELSPHFPGQRVRAPARLWRQAEWIRGSLGRRSPRRGAPLCGVVASVECRHLAVRWLAGAVKDSEPPDEWVEPAAVRVLAVPSSSEGWAIGDHVQSPSWHSPSAVIVESATTVSVHWADGTVETDIPSLRLCPRPHVSAHDFLPNDFVARSGEGGAAEPSTATPREGAGAGEGPAEVPGAGAEAQLGGSTVDPSQPQQDLGGEAESTPMDVEQKVEQEVKAAAQARPPLGVCRSVDLQARTAVVEWASGPQAQQVEEVSVFELTDHPQVDIRLGDAVLVPDAQDQQWAGRVCELRSDGQAHIRLLDGSYQWKEVWHLLVVDDGDGSESAGEGSGSDDESARSEAAPSEGREEPEARTPGADAPDVAMEGPDDDEPMEGPEAKASQAARPGIASGIINFVGDYLGLSGSRSASSGAPAAPPTPPAAAAPADASEDGPPPSATAPAEEPCSGVPAFDAFDDDVEPIDHHFLARATSSSRPFLSAVRREMACLKKGLLEGSTGPAPIVVRTFGSRTDLFRAMVVGPSDTPYSHVPFFFDFCLPSDYPREPPLAYFHAHHVGNERLNPNLYVDGKVCLSLLGTWSGPSWDPQRSTLLQVLVSLQGLVLVEEPYFNEPGHECDAGTEQGQQASTLYNEHARLFALRAALNVAANPPLGFAEIVADYFARFGAKLVGEVEEALEGPSASKSSEGFRKVLAKTLPRLRERFAPVSAVAASAAAAPAAASASAACSAGPEGSASADGDL